MRKPDQKKTACSWGALQTAVQDHYKRHSDRYWYAGVVLTAIGLATCTSHPAHATIAPALKCAGAEHTFSEAVATPTEKRGFVMPDYLAGRGASTSSRHGYGQDEPTRKGGCTASDVCSTSCPPYALEHAEGGFLIVPEGA